jgi:hypothetical protein
MEPVTGDGSSSPMPAANLTDDPDFQALRAAPDPQYSTQSSRHSAPIASA